MDSVCVKLDLWLSTSEFTAYKNGNGELVGELIKNEFDWDIFQNGINRYTLRRRLFRYDRELILEFNKGKIQGKIVRKGPYFDWGIEGFISEDGTLNIEIDGTLSLGVILVGKVSNS